MPSQALDHYRFDAPLWCAKDEEKSRAKEHIVSGMSSISGIQRTSVRNCGMSIMLKSTKVNLFASFRCRTDRIGYLALSPARRDSDCAALLCGRETSG